MHASVFDMSCAYDSSADEGRKRDASSGVVVVNDESLLKLKRGRTMGAPSEACRQPPWSQEGDGGLGV